MGTNGCTSVTTEERAGEPFTSYTDESIQLRGLLEKYPTFGREKETSLPGALDT